MNIEFKLGKGFLETGKNKIEIVSDISADDFNYILNLHNEFKTETELGFKRLKKLGSGSFGDVYEYKNYAIKFIYRMSWSHNPQQSDVFKYEPMDSIVLKDLQGVECVPKYYALIDNRVLIMEKIEGMTVDKYNIYARECDSKNFINPLFNEIYTRAIKHIMKRGYSPADCHSENVMVNLEGNPVIIDFGLFRKFPLNRYENVPLEDINVNDYSDSWEAIDWICTPMDKYISRKKSYSEAIEIVSKYQQAFQTALEI